MTTVYESGKKYDRYLHAEVDAIPATGREESEVITRVGGESEIAVLRIPPVMPLGEAPMFLNCVVSGTCFTFSMKDGDLVRTDPSTPGVAGNSVPTFQHLNSELLAPVPDDRPTPQYTWILEPDEGIIGRTGPVDPPYPDSVAVNVVRTNGLLDAARVTGGTRLGSLGFAPPPVPPWTDSSPTEGTWETTVWDQARSGQGRAVAPSFDLRRHVDDSGNPVISGHVLGVSVAPTGGTGARRLTEFSGIPSIANPLNHTRGQQPGWRHSGQQQHAAGVHDLRREQLSDIRERRAALPIGPEPRPRAAVSLNGVTAPGYQQIRLPCRRSSDCGVVHLPRAVPSPTVPTGTAGRAPAALPTLRPPPTRSAGPRWHRTHSLGRTWTTFGNRRSPVARSVPPVTETFPDALDRELEELLWPDGPGLFLGAPVSERDQVPDRPPVGGGVRSGDRAGSVGGNGPDGVAEPYSAGVGVGSAAGEASAGAGGSRVNSNGRGGGLYGAAVRWSGRWGRGRGGTPCSTGRVSNARSWCSGTSTTSPPRRPRRSCTAPPAPRSAPPATTGPTRATRRDCGTSRGGSPEPQRFSRTYRGRGELIDHILVSRALVDLIADGAVTTDTAGPAPSITDDPGTRRDAPGSDHRPVLAAINL